MHMDLICKGIYTHAEDAYPNECVGVVTPSYQLIRLKNIADDPHNHFVISDREAACFVQGSLFMYHSHPNRPAALTVADHQCAERMRLPLMALSWPHGSMRSTGPIGVDVPLEGRPFIYGVFDCLSLVTAFYHKYMGIALPEGTRPKFGWWNTTDLDPFTWAAEVAGFKEVDTLKYGDIIMLSVNGSKVPNHIEVYVGNNKVMSHRLFTLSRIEQYDNKHRDATLRVMRYDN